MVFSSHTALMPFPLSVFEQLAYTVKDAAMPIGEPLRVALAPYFDAYEAVGKSIGVSFDAFLFITCLLLCYPLSFLMRFLHTPTSRHLFSFLGGLIISFICFGYEGLHPLALCTGSYLIMLLAPRTINHLVVFFYAFGYLSIVHIFRMHRDYLGVRTDFSAQFMMMVCKVCSCAINYYDGSRDPEKMRKEHRAVRLIKLPSLLEYYGYNFFFPATLAGPVYEFDDYIKFATEYGGMRPAFPYGPVLYNIVFFVIGFIGFQSISLVPREAAWDLNYPWSLNFYQRIFYVWMMPTLYRFKFYMVWYLAEGCLLTAGMGYNPETGKWDKVQQVDLIGYEFATSIKTVTDSWNISVSSWLKKYVFLRLNEGKKPGTLNYLASYVTSAFWHGFYPGYYLFFVGGGLGTSVSKTLRRKLRPYFVSREPKGRFNVTPLHALYNIGGYIITQFAINYTGCAFILLSAEATINLWNSTFWLPHLGLILCYIICPLIPEREYEYKKNKKAAVESKPHEQ